MTLDYLAHPDAYTRDTYCKIFFPSCAVRDTEVQVDRKNRTIRNLETNSSPLIVHGNGYSPWYQYLYDSFFSDIYSLDKSALAAKNDKTVFLVIDAHAPGALLQKHLISIDELMYDKSLITIYIEPHNTLLSWAKKNESTYAKIITADDESSVEAFLKEPCDFYFKEHTLFVFKDRGRPWGICSERCASCTRLAGPAR